MKGFRTAALALVLLTVVTPAFADWGTGSAVSPTKAPNREGRWDIGVMGGGAFNSDFDDGAYVQTQVSYGLAPWLGLGFEIGYQKNDGDWDGETIEALPILIDCLFRFPNLHESIVPYGVFGVGIMSAWVTNDDANDVDSTGIVWKVGMGADWFVHPDWIAYVEAAYFNGDVKFYDRSSADEVDFLTLGGGVKYVH